MDRNFISRLTAKYEGCAPRYTSYPAIPYWGDVDSAQVEGWLDADTDEPLSLYVHVPFCRSQCLYCGCFTVISTNRTPVASYLQALKREMYQVARHLGSARRVPQLHFGGGTPTFLSRHEIADLVDSVRTLFQVDANAELSIELDPRTVMAGDLEHLRSIGFNRISLGVQDFDPNVQARVNRRQPARLVSHLVDAARMLNFRSVNFDLIYGLPKQSEASFEETLNRVLEMAPDRLALYNYAHLPHLFPHQGRIPAAELPDAQVKLAIFLRARERLTEGGYEFIGMDHFARADDELVAAHREGTLRRNFMGYTTQAGASVLGFGVGAISEMNGHFWQNEKDLGRYATRSADGALPVVRGIELTAEDRLRQACIHSLFCHGRIDFPELEARFGLNASRLLSSALEGLSRMETDGLVTLDAHGVTVTEAGRLFLRNIAHHFDAYGERAEEGAVRFSRTA